MSAGYWSRFAENSRGSTSRCRHSDLSLANDDEPTITCRACGKRWTFVPPGVDEPQYGHDDDPMIPNTLDDRGWQKGVRVVMRGVRGGRS